MSSQSLGAYFQCYRSPMATYKCLESFRRHYPTATVVLLSDNGYNYAKMADHFGCIYIHGHENFRMCDIEPKNVVKLLDRIQQAFQLIPEDYIMWLEDDVVVNQVITDTFRYDINGFCPNTYSPETVRALKCLKNDTYRWSGHGGSVFHKENLVTYLGNKPMVEDVLENWTQYKLTTNFCQDFVISLLVNLQDGTIGPYEGHADGYHGLNPFIKIQHQYKVWYHVPLPQELVHLIE